MTIFRSAVTSLGFVVAVSCCTVGSFVNIAQFTMTTVKRCRRGTIVMQKRLKYQFPPLMLGLEPFEKNRRL